MPGSSITRSVNGCLTCKNRKKKCDETRPVCTRCINGDFECLGYDYPDLPKGPRRRRKKAPGAPRPSNSPASIASSTPSFCLPAHNPPEVPAFHHSAVTPPTHAIVQTPQVNELNPDHIVQMFIFYSQQTPNAVQPFKPFHFSVLGAITDRIRSSILTLRSAYVEARIKKAVVDGAGLSIGVQLIDNFQRQITNTRAIPDMNPADVATHINSLFSLAFYTMHILNTPIAYSIIRKTVPFFLALAAKSQELWTEDLSISIRHALANPNVAITHFVFLDTVIALVLGTCPAYSL
ncbi:hypothetical protein OPQ81_000434 [Rhizoctonia solani]|nr:hypothetical protein OPQ81_000434 [Rhizoctonia solani]